MNSPRAFPRSLVVRRVLSLLALVAGAATADDEPRFPDPIHVAPHLLRDVPGIEVDYPIVYVRAPRAGDDEHRRFYTDFATPVTMEHGADLVLLKPDGSEEVLAEGGNGSITDPVVSFDGEWIYFVRIHNLRNHDRWAPPREGADIFKIHLASRRIVRLTNQVFTPNTGAADWSPGFRTPVQGKTHLEYGVFNMGPCPLPGGRIVFTSNRDAFRPPRGYPPVALQLFVMDDRDTDVPDGDPNPSRIEKIGFLNNAGALHPVVLRDGRIMFSSLESQGIRGEILWGIWTMRPDGTDWRPMVSAFDPGGAPNGFHFQTQLGDGSVVFEGYYNQNNSGFGMFVKLQADSWSEYPAFGPARMQDPRNRPWRVGRFDNGKGRWYRMPFMPLGAEALTPFAAIEDMPADRSVLEDPESPRVGKVTHPSGAPDNHLLCVYSPGPVNHQYRHLPQLDGGIYLIPDGAVADEPGDLVLIRNDPRFNESWPRAVVPYARIHGVPEPRLLARSANDGTRSRVLPEGSPFGLIGSASLYKRETYPNGVVPDGSVTGTFAGDVADLWRGLDAFTSHGNGMPLNWHNQGAEAGLYVNDDIHAVRILAMEPTTDRQRGDRPGRLFFNHARERLRILGEIPVRKFDASGGQPIDPDGNPDTSFLARIPADTAFTFQTIDRQGMVLNMSQTWHQLRPGEVRNDCGGCHAHSQVPTEFANTAAARDAYEIWDLVHETPLITGRPEDVTEGPSQWDEGRETGLRRLDRPVADVEYFRDVRPILDRSCAACHSRERDEPAGNLVLDADDERIPFRHEGEFPGTYFRLALDEEARFGHPPPTYDSWGYPQASRYVRMFQSRRSLLVWKIFGRRLDGFSNDDHPSESEPGSGVLAMGGRPVDPDRFRAAFDLDHLGDPMPPPEAVEQGRVAPLRDEDRRTIVRWIDLGCPIDLDFDPADPGRRGFGWMADDNRPVVAVHCDVGSGREAGRLGTIVLGLFDYGSGLDLGTLEVRANMEIEGRQPGENLAPLFRPGPPGEGTWTLPISRTFEPAPVPQIEVTVADRAGNLTRISRRIVE